MTDDSMEARHPKIILGVSAAVVLSILITGGQLLYSLGHQSSRVDQVIVAQQVAEVRAAGFVTREEYSQGNLAMLRELDRMNDNIENLARQIERISATRTK